MDQGTQKKPMIIAIIVLVLLLLGVIIYLVIRNSKESDVAVVPTSSPTTTSSILAEYKIENVPYYAEAGFCYGASAMMVLEYKGLSADEAQEYKKEVEGGKGGPPDIFIGFNNLGLEDSVYMAYSINYNQQFRDFYDSFVADPEKQVILFDSQEEAFGKLKELISQNNPVITIIDSGNHYVVVTGYDSDLIYVNDPDPDNGGASKKIPIQEFLAQWNVKNQSETTGQALGYPGDYSMIWFDDKLEINEDDIVEDDEGDGLDD